MAASSSRAICVEILRLRTKSSLSRVVLARTIPAWLFALVVWTYMLKGNCSKSKERSMHVRFDGRCERSCDQRNACECLHGLVLPSYSSVALWAIV